MVSVSNAVSDKHTVMLPLQDANVADVAVPGSWRSHALARGAEFPTRIFNDWRQYDKPSAGICQPKADEIAHQVEQKEKADGIVQN